MDRWIPQILTALICLCSCQNQDPPQKTVQIFTDRAMTMEYRIQIGKALTSSEAEKVLQIVNAIFDHVNRTYNNWNPDSEISQLNRMPANKEVKISADLMRLLKITEHLVALTSGYFDPTVAPLAKLWKAQVQGAEMPPQEEIERLRPAIGWDKIVLTDDGFLKKHPLTSLDLCAIAKGYCVDLITEGLIAAGFSDVYVEWGGEIRAAGSHPEGRPWNIYISRLEDIDPSHAIDYIALHNNAVATSGDYLQSWQTSDGHRYTHIINPKKLYPIEITSCNICSATVLADSCVVADALATAAVAFPESLLAETWAKQLQQEYPSIQFWFVTRGNYVRP